MLENEGSRMHPKTDIAQSVAIRANLLQGLCPNWHKQVASCLRFLGLQSAGKRTLCPPKISEKCRCCVPQYPPSERRCATEASVEPIFELFDPRPRSEGLAQDPGRGSFLFLLRKAQPTTLPRYFPYIESYVPLTYRVGCCTFYPTF